MKATNAVRNAAGGPRWKCSSPSLGSRLGGGGSSSATSSSPASSAAPFAAASSSFSAFPASRPKDAQRGGSKCSVPIRGPRGLRREEGGARCPLGWVDEPPHGGRISGGGEGQRVRVGRAGESGGQASGRE
eukprot:scaffold75767_cov28-Tisochrysis_lutea.AAC.6